MATRTALPPIRKTVFYPSASTGRRECWEAQTVDGQWTFVRTEDVGTPWVVFEAGGHIPQTWCGTLRSARMWAASQ